jgi:hypothetical protein
MRVRPTIQGIPLTVVVLLATFGGVAAQTPTPELPKYAEHVWARMFVAEDGDIYGETLGLVAWQYDTEEHANDAFSQFKEELEKDEFYTRSDHTVTRFTDEVALWEDTTIPDAAAGVLLFQTDETFHAWFATGFDDPSGVLLRMYEHHISGHRRESDVLPTEAEVPPGLELHTDYSQ